MMCLFFCTSNFNLGNRHHSFNGLFQTRMNEFRPHYTIFAPKTDMDIDFFLNRKTVRRYKDIPISKELIHRMLDAAAQSPTTGGMQLYSAVVTTDPHLKAELAKSHFSQPAATGAPVLVTFCADFNRFIKWCDIGNANHGFGNLQSFIAALFDTTIFAQQFCTIAEMYGWGCCYLGTTTYNAPQIAESLNLPKYVIPVLTLSIGIPDDSSPKAERLPLRGIVHDEQYSDYSAADIKALYKEKESLPANVDFTKENHKEHLSQVFTDVRYPKENNEIFSKIFYDFLERQGFRFP